FREAGVFGPVGPQDAQLRRAPVRAAGGRRPADRQPRASGAVRARLSGRWPLRASARGAVDGARRSPARPFTAARAFSKGLPGCAGDFQIGSATPRFLASVDLFLYSALWAGNRKN